MLKCAMLLFLSQRTYPKIRPATIKLWTKYNKATAADMEKAMRVAEYVYGCKDTHVMVSSPKQLTLVSAANALYAEQPMGRATVEELLGLHWMQAVILASFHPNNP
jgi:hypothetical protein